MDRRHVQSQKRRAGCAGEEGHRHRCRGLRRHAGVAHKSKTAAEVGSYEGPAPQWFADGVQAALLAPTALNKQCFRIVGEGGKVSISENGGTFSGADIGIVKYHFELGAGNAFEWA